MTRRSRPASTRAPSSTTDPRHGPSTGPMVPGPSSHPVTGTCSPGLSRASTARASTRTLSSTSLSATPCWMPASAPGTPNAATTSSGRSPPRPHPRRQDDQGLGRTRAGNQGHPGRAVPLLHPHPAVPRLCVRAQHLQRRRRSVLRSFTTGSDTLGPTVDFAAGSSFVEPGTVPAATVQLGWSTYTAAAGEAGLSREYGGIHFRDAHRVRHESPIRLLPAPHIHQRHRRGVLDPSQANSQ